MIQFRGPVRTEATSDEERGLREVMWASSRPRRAELSVEDGDQGASPPEEFRRVQALTGQRASRVPDTVSSLGRSKAGRTEPHLAQVA